LIISSTASAITAIRLRPRPKYLAIVVAAIQRAITYRRSILLNLLASLIWVTAQYYLWRAIFLASPTVGSFDWHQMQTYILVSYAINTLFSFSSATMIHTIRTGDIAIELLHPVDFIKAQLAVALGSAVIEGLLSSSFTILLGFWVLAIALPASPLAAILFLPSVCLGFLIKFLINFLVALLCFWTLNARGLIWTQTAVANILSGALVPIEFLPDWLKIIALAAPFRATIYAPLTIYLGIVQGTALWWTITIQAFWVVALWWLAQRLWTEAVQALELQGG